MEKLITFAVPCYNSAAYMDHCVQTLLTAGEDIEIILVDDGSTKDDTPAICDRYAAQYPDVVRAIHQENGGHGEGVNQGIRHAAGLYYKVVDSDDWLDEGALGRVMDKLREFAAAEPSWIWGSSSPPSSSLSWEMTSWEATPTASPGRRAS